ncbi:ribulokinase [Lysinibacillus sp. NPDC097287]|uniref:ribulokinase n=1 Tax=Lysinibacillus sp. NPDC097287 TaxID=3364144 RepID=UPI00380C0627
MKYVIGVDFGSESARAILMNTETGICHKSVSQTYEHGIITGKLFGKPLKHDTVLQHPNDYLSVLTTLVHQLLEEPGVSAQQIIGIGIDFTSCTVVPVDEEFTPLLHQQRFWENPHAYVKLWKHHAAEEEAKKLNEQCRQDKWIERYGHIVSSEWLLPKIMEIANDDPHFFNEVAYFMEAGDWLVSTLTGTLSRSSCFAGYKGMWSKQDGFISNEQLRKIHHALPMIYDTKLRGTVQSIGQRAGYLTEEIASRLRLTTKTAVGVAIIDAHAALLGAGVSQPNELVMVMGTSTCHLMVHDKEIFVPGISGVVEDGILPGAFAYESGQVAVGDLFAYFMKNHVPSNVVEESEERDISIFQLLEEQATALQPGENQLIVLDYHNGNRTPYVNGQLSGVVVGETLTTTTAMLYRGYLESFVNATRVIIELYEAHGLPVQRLIATGGIPQKNKLLMQLYADILQKEIEVCVEQQVPAVGAAILGAMAATPEDGGFTHIEDAIEKLCQKEVLIYQPNVATKKIYDELFSCYKELSEYFAEKSAMMGKLKQLKYTEEKMGNVK